MKHELLKAMALVCLCILLIVAAFACTAIERAADGVTALVASGKLTVEDVHKQVADPKTGLLHELTDAARAGRHTIDILQATSLAERSKVAEFSDASTQAVRDLSGVENAAKETLETLNRASGELGNTIVAFKQDAEGAKPAIDGAAQLLGTLDRGSSEILKRADSTVGHVDSLVAGMQPIEAELQETGKHFDQGTDWLQQTLHFIRDDFSPKKKSFWLVLLDKVTNGAVSAAVSIFLPEHVVVR